MMKPISQTSKVLLTLMSSILLTTSVICANDAIADEPHTKTYDKIPNPFAKKGQPVEVVIVNGNATVEGDISLGSESFLDKYQNTVQSQSASQSSIINSGYWPSGIVPFEILDGFTDAERQTIINALNSYSVKTNVCFTYRVGESSRIKFKKSNALGLAAGESRLGKCDFITCPDGQEIQLAPGLDTSRQLPRVVLHEVGHALGLRHEHTRNDRDSFISIIWSNINFLYQNQFWKSVFNDSTDKGAYDFDSIMHYRYNEFGIFINGIQQRTIVKISDPSNTSFGQASVLSNGDIAGVNSIYRTDRACATLNVLSPGELALNQSRTINVNASVTHNQSGIYMRQGQTFQFTTGVNKSWNNGNTRTTCNGYPGGFFDGLRRHGDINMMALTGELFSNTGSYLGKYKGIGCGTTTWTAPVSGYFRSFANDIITGYGDNVGSISLTVKRTQ